MTSLFFCLIYILLASFVFARNIFQDSSSKFNKKAVLLQYHEVSIKQKERTSALQTLHRFRGGKKGVKKIDKKKKKEDKKKGFIVTIKDALDQLKPATRYYLLLSLFCEIIHLVGLPAPAILSLNINRLFEIWRPFTAVSYFGAPSLSAANSIYFLVNYGQRMETINGTGEHAWFLFAQTIILSMLGLLLKIPFLGQAMIAATVYVSCRMNPFERMPFQFGLAVTSWQLPYCSMIIDCLAQQNAAAAWPHILGIFSGHIYHYWTVSWPQLGGKKAYLTAPKWILKRLGGKPSSNVVGIDFRKDKQNIDSESSGNSQGSLKSSKVAKLIKKAKQSKGHKLG